MRALLCLALLVGCRDGAPKQAEPAVCPKPEEIGRYQLFQGTIRATYTKAGVEVDEPVVFRLDTVTGKTSQYMKYYSDKEQKVREFWSDD